jgi:hypothetical protein
LVFSSPTRNAELSPFGFRQQNFPNVFATSFIICHKSANIFTASLACTLEQIIEQLHPLWYNISFPIACELYLRQETIDKLNGKYKTLQFSPKTEMLVKMFNRLKPYFAGTDKYIELIVDGGDAKKSVLAPLSQEEIVCVITRVRKDARL